MSSVCQIIITITLDTLDKKVYTLDILETNIEQLTCRTDHGKSFYGGKE
jgi:hypothetical protein